MIIGSVDKTAETQVKKQLLFSKKSGIMIFVYGVWRSLVARSAGGREVAGSNPVTPIFPLKSRVFDDFCHRKLLFF